MRRICSPPHLPAVVYGLRLHIMRLAESSLRSQFLQTPIQWVDILEEFNVYPSQPLSILEIIDQLEQELT